MERRRVMNKVLQGRSRMTTPIFLCLLFSFFLLTSCGNKLEQRFSEEQCIQRLSSLSWDSEDRHKAEAFASNLALPVEQSYNEESMNTDCFLLVERGEGSEDRASVYKNPFKRVYPASITKLMTALVCVENVSDLDQEFVVSPSSSIKVSGSSTAF